VVLCLGNDSLDWNQLRGLSQEAVAAQVGPPTNAKVVLDSEAFFHFWAEDISCRPPGRASLESFHKVHNDLAVDVVGLTLESPIDIHHWIAAWIMSQAPAA